MPWVNARATSVRGISSASSHSAIRDTVMYQGVEIGEAEETMAFKCVSFSLLYLECYSQ